MKNFLILFGIILAFIGGYFFSQKYNFNIETKTTDEKPTLGVEPTSAQKPLVGADKDEYGCIGSAGYTWCEDKQKCLRVWEEPCEKVDNEKDIKQAILTKHGWSEEEVNITISKEDGTFARGGIKEVDAVGGGMFLAKKINDEWQIVFEGNGVPDCSLLKTTHSFPIEFLTGICD